MAPTERSDNTERTDRDDRAEPMDSQLPAENSDIDEPMLPTETGYSNGFLMLTGALVLAVLAALLIPSVPRDPRTHAEPDVALRHPEAANVAGATLVGDDPE